MVGRRQRSRTSCLASLLAVGALVGPQVSGFYLPGVAPIQYLEGAKVDLKVNKLTSSKTQLPYGYYTLPYCQPKDVKESVENLGELLVGDIIENSPFEISMLVNKSCEVLCVKKLTAADRQKFRSKVEDEYVVNWMVDNLPAATRYIWNTGNGAEQRYMSGFHVGFVDGENSGRVIVSNHFKLMLQYHSNPDDYEGFRVVGFEVEPHSIVQAVRSDPSKESGFTAFCDEASAKPLFDVDQHEEVVFTYDVEWLPSEVRWASRWDVYLKLSAGKIHWFSILNSLVIMLFLSGMVAMILMRTIYRDITRYNELATAEEAAEETGWKLVHGDVFRKPRFSKLLAVSVGSGMQILGMSVVTLLFALLGFLSPAHRGGLLQCMMLLFTFMGSFAGYACARFYRIFGGEGWRTATLMVAFLYPGLMFGIFFMLNLLIWGAKSSGAVPFTTMFALLVLWFGISVPLAFLGSYFGIRKEVELPVKISQFPRNIPTQQWFVGPVSSGLVGGVLPFGAVFTELSFIMSSLWQHQFYYLFGFLALVLCILLVTCAEISIALTYFQLAGEDYRWWWRSFFTCASSGVYVFLYSIMYFNSRLHIESFVSTALYYGYMLLISMVFALLTGSIGTVSSFFFVRGIYGSIKVD